MSSVVHQPGKSFDFHVPVVIIGAERRAGGGFGGA